jgi:ABC-type transport system involved in cytochrome c biogenesis ATPase subunit
VALVIAGFFVKQKNKEDMPAETAEQIVQLKRTIDEERAFVARIDAETEDYLSAHGKCFDENLAGAMLQELTTEAVEYTTLKNRQKRENSSTKAADCEALREKIAAFLEQYHITAAEEHFSDELYGLKTKAARCRTLRDKKGCYEQAQREYAQCEEILTKFLKEYGYEAQADVNFYVRLNGILDDVKKYISTKDAQEQAKKELAQFEEQNDMMMVQEDAVEAETLPSLELINQRIVQLNEKMEASHNVITQYNKELENLRARYDEWEEKNNKLAELKETQAAEQAQYDYIFLARQKLSEAKNAMTAKYAEPILQSFRSYYGMITGQNTDALHVDANMKVTVDEFGKQREVITLSTGYQDIIGICLRIALIDAMYQEERPMIILDDPFTNLDDAKAEDAKRFLEQLAAKYQLIYFTCSNTRSVP